MGSHEADALENTQNQLKSWILKNSPDYAQADQLYAQHSQPINTMETAQDLYKGLVEGQTLNVSHDATPTLSQYRTQLAKALKNAEYGIEPEAETKLKAIQQDLQRESISNSLKFGGADTYFNSQAPNWLSGQLFGKELDGKSMLGRVLGATGGASTGGVMGMLGGGVAAQKIGQFVGNRVNGQFQKAMLDPDYFAKLLADALKRQSADPTALQKLSPVGTRAATTGVEGLMSPN
jgi:hypothetical protein